MAEAFEHADVGLLELISAGHEATAVDHDGLAGNE